MLKSLFYCLPAQPSIGMHLPELVQPVLTCFDDPDARVRYYACESLYNISKVARGAVLVFFNSTFDGLCKVSHIHTHILMHAHTHIHVYLCTHTRTHTRVYLCTRTHTHTRTTYAHTLTHVLMRTQHTVV